MAIVQAQLAVECNVYSSCDMGSVRLNHRDTSSVVIDDDVMGDGSAGKCQAAAEHSSLDGTWAASSQPST